MENKKTYAPLSFLYFIFAMQVLLQWAIFQGLFAGDTNLLNGLTGLICFPIYILGAKMLSDSGDHYSANTFIIYGTLFGGVFGVCGIASYFDARLALGLDPTFMAIPMLVSGVIILPSLPTTLYLPWTECLTWVLVTLWILLGGLTYYIYSYWLFALNTYLALIVGLLVLYMGASELLKSLGMPGLPAGKPLRKLPEYPSEQ